MSTISGTNRSLHEKYKNRVQNKAPQHTGILKISLSYLEPSPKQNRHSYDEVEIKQLADSIERYGQIQPITVRPLGANSSGEETYQIISGHRRWKACQFAKKRYILATISSTPLKYDRWVNFEENDQRLDFTPFEVAEFYRVTMLEEGLTQQQLAQRLGKQQSKISEILSILNIPAEIRSEMEEYPSGDIPLITLKKLAKIKNLPKIFASWQTIKSEIDRGEHTSERVGERRKKKSVHHFGNNVDTKYVPLLRSINTVDRQFKKIESGKLVIDKETLEKIEEIVKKFQKIVSTAKNK